jgi:3-deoxy-D-manno-octulosonic acid kinase
MADHALPAELAETHVLHARGGVALLVRRDWEGALPVQAMLEGAPLAEWGKAVPHSLSGRGGIDVLSTPRGEIVAKRLGRGGLMGGLLRYLFLDESRPFREAAVAEGLRRAGLATPEVVAARSTRRAGVFHELEIATARVSGATDLLAALRNRGPDAALGRATGATLRALHDAGLRHRDLQARNLLVPPGFPGPGGSADPEALIVIDLDRCSMGAPLLASERVAALARLGRSLVKTGVLPRRGLGDRAALAACRAALDAYGAVGGAGPAALLGAVSRRVRREVALHRPLWPALPADQGSAVPPRSADGS